MEPQVRISDLKVLAQANELFRFCVANRTTNYYDLNDDGQQVIDVALISSMNVASMNLVHLND